MEDLDEVKPSWIKHRLLDLDVTFPSLFCLCPNLPSLKYGNVASLKCLPLLKCVSSCLYPIIYIVMMNHLGS